MEKLTVTTMSDLDASLLGIPDEYRSQYDNAYSLIMNGLVNHSKDPSKAVSAYDFLLGAGVNRNKLLSIMDQFGVEKPVYGALQIFENPAEQAQFIQEYLQERNETIDPSLNAWFKTGFNVHGPEHTWPVTVTEFELGHLANVSYTDMLLAAFIGPAHDKFLGKSRPLHPFGSALTLFITFPELLSQQTLNKIFPERTITPKNFVDAIRWHDEKIASAEYKKLIESFEGGFEIEALYKKSREYFSQAALILRISDKIWANDRGRTTKKELIGMFANKRDVLGVAVNDDKFTEVVALSKLEGWRLKDGVFRQRVKFNPVYDETKEKLPDGFHAKSSQRKGKRKVWVSEETAKEYRIHGIPHFFTWFRRICANDIDRLKVESLDLFTLFDGQGRPEVERFDYELFDSNGFDSRRGVGFDVHVYRDNPFATFEALEDLAFEPNKLPEEFVAIRDFWRNPENVDEFKSNVKKYFKSEPKEHKMIIEQVMAKDGQGRPLITIKYVIKRGKEKEFIEHMKLMFWDKRVRTGESAIV